MQRCSLTSGDSFGDSSNSIKEKTKSISISDNSIITQDLPSRNSFRIQLVNCRPRNSKFKLDNTLFLNEDNLFNK